MELQLAKPFIQNLPSFNTQNVIVNVLRLDVVHPIVSGNKWFKLQCYLKDATDKNYKTVVTFGGAFSNHIVATAFACKQFNLKSIGIIRGDEPAILSHTLLQCKEFGMELQFVSRENYKNKSVITNEFDNNKFYIIDEGGFGILGAKGAATILDQIDAKKYTHIICSCGTGTMLAGIINAALPHQKIIGINSLKGYENIEIEIKKILTKSSSEKSFTIFNNYHFGGYAKHPTELINWMNELWKNEKLPTDIVYTSKLFFALKDLINSNYFGNNDSVLAIHSGGLQGNLSLPAGVLDFH